MSCRGPHRAATAARHQEHAPLPNRNARIEYDRIDRLVCPQLSAGTFVQRKQDLAYDMPIVRGTKSVSPEFPVVCARAVVKSRPGILLGAEQRITVNGDVTPVVTERGCIVGVDLLSRLHVE